MGSQRNVTMSEEQKSEEMLDKSLCSRQRKIHEQRDVPKDRKLGRQLSRSNKND